MTVLGTFVLPGGGSAWTASLLAALELVGIETRSARQVVNRTAAAGWLTSEKHGRKVRWSLSSRTRPLLAAGAERIYRFGSTTTEWDGRWVLLQASVPETQRDLRYRLKVRLNWAGFGPLGPGLWIAPWVAQEAEAIAVIDALGEPIEARTFIAQHGHLGEAADVAAQAWDLAALAGEYHRFLDRWGAPDASSPEESDEESDADVEPDGSAARELLELVHDWRRFPAIDPALPAVLLPDDWPGAAAADRFSVRRRQLLGPAEAWWAVVERRSGG